MLELHDGPTGGHYSGDTTTHKILRAGYYWPTLFKDAHAHVRKCDIFQRCGRRQPKAAAPLKPVMITKPFEQWGLDIIGEIKLNSSLQHKYILIATDYFTRWVEAIPLRKINEDEVISFLQDHIMTRFGVPVSLVFDNAKYFSSIKLTAFAHDKGIKLHYSANYYPQGNGLAESSNKNLIRILKKTVIENQRSWHSVLPNALWSDRVTPKSSIGVSPYTLVYGKEAILPPNIMLPSSIIAQESRGSDDEVLQIRIYNLLKAEEARSKTRERFKQQQEVIKRWFNKHKAGTKDFEVGDLVLKWDHPHDEKGKHTKFQ